MNNAPLTVVGNLVAEPELKFIANGNAIANMRIAVNHRRKTEGEWGDESSFLTITAWDTLGENCAASLSKGMRVIATGRLQIREYENAAGEKRSSTELVAEAVGPDLRFATVDVSRIDRTSGTDTRNEEPF